MNTNNTNNRNQKNQSCRIWMFSDMARESRPTLHPVFSTPAAARDFIKKREWTGKPEIRPVNESDNRVVIYKLRVDKGENSNKKNNKQNKNNKGDGVMAAAA